tara:strand:- start:1010 stop:1498 length:489 start_codon:yes stop_codon:yes gene_type:complete
MKANLSSSNLDNKSNYEHKVVKLVKSTIDKTSEAVYYNTNTGNTGINKTNDSRRQNTMAKSIEVLENIKTICRNEWGNESMYEGPSGKYKWETGRDTGNGIINGVVRKFVAEDKDGNEIYTVAGSFKINSDGEVSRWTGLPRRFQKEASDLVKITNGHTNGD